MLAAVAALTGCALLTMRFCSKHTTGVKDQADVATNGIIREVININTLPEVSSDSLRVPSDKEF